MPLSHPVSIGNVRMLEQTEAEYLRRFLSKGPEASRAIQLFRDAGRLSGSIGRPRSATSRPGD
jgi:hypothetical protein